jgi:hypothetical protein
MHSCATTVARQINHCGEPVQLARQINHCGAPDQQLQQVRCTWVHGVMYRAEFKLMYGARHGGSKVPPIRQGCDQRFYASCAYCESSALRLVELLLLASMLGKEVRALGRRSCVSVRALLLGNS